MLNITRRKLYKVCLYEYETSVEGPDMKRINELVASLHQLQEFCGIDLSDAYLADLMLQLASPNNSSPSLKYISLNNTYFSSNSTSRTSQFLGF